MDESHRCTVEWKKPDTKEYTLFFEVQEQAKLIYGGKSE